MRLVQSQIRRVFLFFITCNWGLGEISYLFTTFQTPQLVKINSKSKIKDNNGNNNKNNKNQNNGDGTATLLVKSNRESKAVLFTK